MSPRRIVAAGLAFAIATSGCADQGRGSDDQGDRRRTEQDAGSCVLRAEGPRTGDVPMAVDGIGARDVWVVGAHYVGGDGVPFARRWNGDRWEATDVPMETGPDAGFHDVAAVSSGDVWAVGSVHASEPLVRRWDGAAWSDVPVPSIGADEAELFGVAAAGRRAAWAVGRALAGRRWRALVLGWDGARWKVVDAPTPIRADAALRGADAAAADDVWAVGWSVERGGRHRTLAMRFDGRSWRTTETPDPGVGDQVLSAVAAVNAGEAWAVGWTIGTDGRDRPLILRWGGDRWRPVPAPPIAASVQLVDVAATRTGDVWIAGRAMDRTGTYRALVLRGSGSSWSVVPAPDVGALDDTLAGIALIDGSLWSVGTSVDDTGLYASLVLSGC